MTVITGLVSILVLGVGAQWVAWRFKIPSIIILLLFGFLVGPIFTVLDPHTLFGDLFFPIISLLVSIIVFDGGLSLKIADLKGAGKALPNLIIWTPILTLAIIAAASFYILNLSLALSVLFGAMMVITGPTVIVPLLKHVNLSRSFGSLMRWEGILIAPIGTILIVLVYQFFFSTSAGTIDIIWVFLKTLLVGVVLGYVGAFVIIRKIQRQWVPDFLQEAVTLMLVVLGYTLSNMVQSGSGLVFVVLMGVLLINQKKVQVQHIIVFKGNLRLLAISTLFIMLSSSLNLVDLKAHFNIDFLWFILVLIFLSRPVPVLLSTIGSGLSWAEKLFLCWMAPRGIVTASIASLFALDLIEQGISDASKLVPIAFLVILVTVTLYGLTAEYVQRWLGLSQTTSKGFLLLGANVFSRSLAKKLAELGVFCLLVDTDKKLIIEARLENLAAFHRNIFSDQLLEEIELGGIGNLLCLTSNDELNLLSTIQYSTNLGQDHVFSLSPQGTDTYNEELIKKFEKGRYLFGKGISYSYLMTRLSLGSDVQAFSFSDSFTLDQFKTDYGDRAIPLLIVSSDKITIIDDLMDLEPGHGDTLLALV